MVNLSLTSEELDFLTDVLNEYEYEDLYDNNIELVKHLQYKIYKCHDQGYQDKLTTIGG